MRDKKSSEVKYKGLSDYRRSGLNNESFAGMGLWHMFHTATPSNTGLITTAFNLHILLASSGIDYVVHISIIMVHIGGVVALSVECRTCDREVVGSTLGWARGVKTLGKFLTPMCLCNEAV